VSSAERQDRLKAFLPALVLVMSGEYARARPVHEVVRDAVRGGASAIIARDMFPPELDPAGKDYLMANARALALLRAAGEDVLTLLRGGTNVAAVAEDLRRETHANVGVHVPERPAPGFSLAPSVRQIREVYPDLIISRAVHSLSAAIAAEEDGADMIVLGTMFMSKSHPGGTILGLNALREVCCSVRIPVVAIGGITPDNARSCMDAGAAGVAVIGAIMDAPDQREAGAALRAAITTGDRRPAAEGHRP